MYGKVYLAEFVAAAVVDEVGVVVGAGPSSLATSSAASWEEAVGTSCVDGAGHGAGLVEDNLARPHPHLLPEEGEGEQGGTPLRHYSAVGGSSEGVLVSYERGWHG